jgi:hypothetical protein
MTGPTLATDCAGKPNALGTSRTVVVDPIEHVRIGMPLADREVVLTFDDAPLPPYTSRALDILASECPRQLWHNLFRSYPDPVRQMLRSEIMPPRYVRNHRTRCDALATIRPFSSSFHRRRRTTPAISARR